MIVLILPDEDKETNGLSYDNDNIYVISYCCFETITSEKQTYTCNGCNQTRDNPNYWSGKMTLAQLHDIVSGYAGFPERLAGWAEFWTGLEDVGFKVSGLES